GRLLCGEGGGNARLGFGLRNVQVHIRGARTTQDHWTEPELSRLYPRRGEGTTPPKSWIPIFHVPSFTHPSTDGVSMGHDLNYNWSCQGPWTPLWCSAALGGILSP